MEKPNPAYPIRVAAQKTGVSPYVIRSWEKRYNAVRPWRSSTNRRLYSQADLKRLILLRTATGAGYRIGHAATLADEELEGLVKPAAWGEAPGSGKQVSGAAGDLLHECLEAISNLDRARLDACLGEAQVSLSIPSLLENLVAPLLVVTGERWHAGAWRVSHEHLATASVREMLHRTRRAIQTSSHAPALVATTPAGQRHEMGALLAGISAATEGWQDIYLGPDTPAFDIVHAVLETKARALALSIIHPCDDPLLEGELDILREALPDGVAVLVGGAGAAAYGTPLKAMGAIPTPTLAEFLSQLAALREAPAPV